MIRPNRRIDHVVVAVRDLDGAADFYQRLGFQVGARNRHPWGTENRLIQFDRSFIELITVAPGAAIVEHEPGRFSFGAFVRDYLREREGLAMLVLDSADAKADAANFAGKGIGSFEPFFFERQGKRPDGGETRVAFTLAFAVEPHSPAAAFFVCQQHYPENFWNPAFQRHANGATKISSVGMAAAEPRDYQGFLEAFSGGAAKQDRDGISIGLNRGSLTVSSDPGEGQGLRFVSLSIAMSDVANHIARLHDAGIMFAGGADGGSSICVIGTPGIQLNFHQQD